MLNRVLIEVCGGIYVDEPCVILGNLISGRTYHDNGKYLGAWIKLLKGEREKVARCRAAARCSR